MYSRYGLPMCWHMHDTSPCNLAHNLLWPRMSLSGMVTDCMLHGHESCAWNAVRCTADTVVQACFKTLMTLLHTRHGSVRELSAQILRQMTASILRVADSSGPAANKTAQTAANSKQIAAVRTQALAFAQDVARWAPLSMIAETL